MLDRITDAWTLREVAGGIKVLGHSVFGVNMKMGYYVLLLDPKEKKRACFLMFLFILPDSVHGTVSVVSLLFLSHHLAS